jgi:hypothetical protein
LAAKESSIRRKGRPWLTKDAYLFTAVLVVAFLKQYLEGKGRKPGLGMMGELVDPPRLMNDMQKMGVRGIPARSAAFVSEATGFE